MISGMDGLWWSNIVCQNKIGRTILQFVQVSPAFCPVLSLCFNWFPFSQLKTFQIVWKRPKAAILPPQDAIMPPAKAVRWNRFSRTKEKAIQKTAHGLNFTPFIPWEVKRGVLAVASLKHFKRGVQLFCVSVGHTIRPNTQWKNVQWVQVGQRASPKPKGTSPPWGRVKSASRHFQPQVGPRSRWSKNSLVSSFGNIVFNLIQIVWFQVVLCQ